MLYALAMNHIGIHRTFIKQNSLSKLSLLSSSSIFGWHQEPFKPLFPLLLVTRILGVSPLIQISRLKQPISFLHKSVPHRLPHLLSLPNIPYIMSNPIPTTVLMLACPATGDVNPMLNIALKVVEHGCHVIFVNTELAHKQLKESSGTDGSKIKFVSIPDGLSQKDDRSDVGRLMLTMMNTMPAQLEKLIEDFRSSGEHRITCIVADVAMGWGIQVAHKLRIKGALLWTGSAVTFAMINNIPMLIDNGIIDSEGMPVTKGTFQLSPSMPEMDTGVIWWSKIYDSITQKKIFHFFKLVVQNLNLIDWCICNTTYELEPGTLSFIPKLLPVGPLLRSCDDSLGQFWEEDLSCMTWLDQHPHRSVVYVAFGSIALFHQTQFTELALGLKLTNRPFLWVVRQDHTTDNKMVYPDEFKVTHGKILEWAPQQKVLSHPAIACFVTHCGWNSTIEGLSSGVPFLCWPYFSDQFYDKTFICDELKVGLGFDSDENGLVSRGEIKMKVDQLLNDDNIRSRSLTVKEELKSNIAEGGRSSENFTRFVEWVKE